MDAMDPVAISKALGDAQSVQQVLAIVNLVLLLVTALLAKLLWAEMRSNKEELRAMYKEQIETFKALKGDHDGK